MSLASTDVDLASGLSDTQVAERVAAGQVNVVISPHARSLTSIVRANTLTYFNFLIGGLWILMLFSAPLIDGLFGLVIVANTAIGIVQEYRAARTLAKLSVLSAPTARVRRAGTEVDLAPDLIVLDDVIALRTGDQLLVDGVLLERSGIEIDESLLTGEADPVAKEIDDEVLSGSFVVAGEGVMKVTRIGAEGYAANLAQEAKSFSTSRSELVTSIQRFIKMVSYVLLPIGLLLFFSQYRANDGRIRDAIAGTVPGVITMVPEGLVLLTSIAMAVSVIRLARKRTLVQEMPAVEILARVDVVCVDKTGTLTAPGMGLRELIPLGDETVDSVTPALASLAAAETAPNPTILAIREALPPPQGWQVTETVPFSSARKWSAVAFVDRGAYVIGAPEVLLPDTDSTRQHAESIAGSGARVLLFARSDATPDVQRGPGMLEPLSLVVIDQRLRADVRETMQYFLDQEVTIKVISGDNAATVGSIAQQAGISAGAGVIDARTMPSDLDALDELIEAHHVFGRVTPTQKREMVGALQRRGHTVAMTGDGVNDVLALKDADLGIAMGSGASATRAVAQIVLLDDQFAVMPSVVAEGRRVLGNVERVSDLFLTKSFYAMVVSVTTVVLALPFPFLNRHLTLVTAFTIGIPSFFLALMPNTARFRPGFFKRVMRFAIPAGVICAASAYTAYGLSLNSGASTLQSRAAASYTLFIVAWWVLVQVARPWNVLRVLICLSMAACFIGAVSIPFVRSLFALDAGAEEVGLVAVGVGVVGAVLVTIAHGIARRWRQ